MFNMNRFSMLGLLSFLINAMPPVGFLLVAIIILGAVVTMLMVYLIEGVTHLGLFLTNGITFAALAFLLILVVLALYLTEAQETK